MVKCIGCKNDETIGILTIDIKAHRCKIDSYIKDGEVERTCLNHIDAD